MHPLIPFLKLFRRQARAMLVGTFLAFVAIIAGIGLLSLSGWFISATGFVATAATTVALEFNYFYPAAGVRAFSLLRIITRYGERVFTHEATFKILTDIRLWVYQKLLPLSPSHLMQYQSGDLLSRLVNDVNELDNLYIRILSPTVVLILAISAVGVFFSFFSISMALTTMGLVTFTGFFIPLITSKLAYKSACKATYDAAMLKTSITRHIHFIAELKIFAAQSTHRKMINKQNQEFIQQQQKLAYFAGFGRFLMTLALGTTLWIAVWMAVQLVHHHALNGAFIALIALAILALFEAVMPLPTAYQYLGKTLSSAKRLLQVSEQKPTVTFVNENTGKTKFNLNENNAHIVFHQVSFSYEKRHPVLTEFNLDIHAKEKVALSGPTGSGKSTLVNLLARFWNPTNGTIQIAGTDIKILAESELRKSMTIIAQKAHIFNASIAENLRISDEKASNDKLWQALKTVDLDRFVRDLPNGLDSWTGEYGQHLSKGQQRRLSLARAALSKAPILILDEPTEGLDKMTEAKVFNALMKLMQQKTVILITHNQKLLQAMDRVIHLD